jgi:hypothetical protein
MRRTADQQAGVFAKYDVCANKACDKCGKVLARFAGHGEICGKREELAKKCETTPAVGLTLEKVELEPAQQAHYKFKLRLYWTNDGNRLHLSKPDWIAGGITRQGSEIGYRYQAWTGLGWGPELTEIEVRENQQCRVYVGLDFDPKGIEMARSLLEQGRLGTLVLPAVFGNDHKIELYVRPKSILFHQKAPIPPAK